MTQMEIMLFLSIIILNYLGATQAQKVMETHYKKSIPLMLLIYLVIPLGIITCIVFYLMVVATWLVKTIHKELKTYFTIKPSSKRTMYVVEKD
jgi:TRAP-type C4-dicarboxylate transport system permease small subunit